MSIHSLNNQRPPSLKRESDGDVIRVRDPNAIATGLTARITKNKPFTRIESRCMIAVRPTRGLPLYSDQTSKIYAEKSKSLSPIEGAHVFDISSSAYHHAIRAKTNQSIMLLYYFNLIIVVKLQVESRKFTVFY